MGGSGTARLWALLTIAILGLGLVPASAAEPTCLGNEAASLCLDAYEEPVGGCTDDGSSCWSGGTQKAFLNVTAGDIESDTMVAAVHFDQHTDQDDPCGQADSDSASDGGGVVTSTSYEDQDLDARLVAMQQSTEREEHDTCWGQESDTDTAFRYIMADAAWYDDEEWTRAYVALYQIDWIQRIQADEGQAAVVACAVAAGVVLVQEDGGLTLSESAAPGGCAPHVPVGDLPA